MIHQDFSSLLIGRDLNWLTEQERLQFQQHLSACDDCARDWELHSRLMTQPVPPMPATLAARCRAAFAGQPDRGKRKHKSGRYILIGTVLAIAAAAALLMLLLARQERSGAEPETPAIDVPQAVDAENNPAAPEGSDADPVKEIRPDAAVLEPAPQEFTVQIMPLIQEATDAARQIAVQEHYEALIAELRAVPGLNLVIWEPPSDPNSAKPDFRVSVNLNPDPTEPEIEPGRWRVALSIDTILKDGSMPRMHVMHYSGLLDVVCTRPMPAGLRCTDAASKAAEQVRYLRVEVFPPDRSLARNLESKVSNSALSFDVRRDALQNLVQLTKTPADWSASALRAAVDLATASNGETRADCWKLLRGIKHPALLDPLLKELQRETNAAWRLELVTTLIQDYATDPAARPTLESLAKSDSRPLVRQLAARAISGVEGWNQYVFNTLKDVNLAATERILPLAYMWRYWERDALRALLGNSDVDSQLAEILPQVWSRPWQLTPGTIVPEDFQPTPLLDMLDVIDRPAAVDILLDALRSSPIASDRSIAAGGLGRRHLDDARVRRALRDAAMSDRDPGVQRSAMRALEREPEPKAEK